MDENAKDVLDVIEFVAKIPMPKFSANISTTMPGEIIEKARRVLQFLDDDNSD